MTDLVKYSFYGADNGRWDDFVFRPDDIVICAPSKCGTTWTQVLCALLIFDGPAFPAPIATLSPWLDQLVVPVQEVHDRYGGQTHRRFIKTHTPLDGVPFDERVTYLCVGRDPRDAAVSLAHHLVNMDLDRFRVLRTAAVGPDPDDDGVRPTPTLDHLAAELAEWIDAPEAQPENLAWMLDFYNGFWARRHEPNVALFHFADHLADLPGALARLAVVLGYAMDTPRIAALAAHAGIDRLRARAPEVMPNAGDRVFKDPSRFFRSGTGGAWRGLLTDDDVWRYDARVAAAAPADLVAWMHGGGVVTT